MRETLLSLDRFEKVPVRRCPPFFLEHTGPLAGRGILEEPPRLTGRQQQNNNVQNSGHTFLTAHQ